MNSLKEQLVDFIKANEGNKYPKSKWICSDYASIYVRATWKHIPSLDKEKLTRCLGIASIEVEKTMRGSGIFTEFLADAEEVNPWPAIYIENVLEEGFSKFFEKRNWILLNENDELIEGFPKSYWKKNEVS